MCWKSTVIQKEMQNSVKEMYNIHMQIKRILRTFESECI